MVTRRSPFDTPLATYRLQLNREFTFDHAARILPYLAGLGISHIYCAPFLQARAGSLHGYDIVDYARISAEIGGEKGFQRFAAALAAHGLGLILDFVPNHMGVGHADNTWWLDVLEWGEASPWSRYFDIDWSPPRRELRGKVLLPILGASYGAALCGGDIDLRYDAATGTFDFWYFDHRLPVNPRDYQTILGHSAGIPPFADSMRLIDDAVLAKAEPSYLRKTAAAAKAALRAATQDPDAACLIENAVAAWRGREGEPQTFIRLHDLLQRQAYRLAHWRAASDELNYRRFFDIEDLAGIRMDRIEVFHATHAMLGELLSKGLLHGLRIDHVDGLADPQRYCRRLNAFAATIGPRAGDGRRVRPYIVVEKILARHEILPASWPVSGTTGYDYLALANGLFIDPKGYERLQRHWSRFTGLVRDIDREMYACRRLVIDRSLSSELAYLVNQFVEIAEADWSTRDFTRKRLRDALIEIVAAFEVYRTYVTERGASAADRCEIEAAIARARARWSGGDEEILDFIESVLTLHIAHANPAHFAAMRPTILRVVTRLQQYTGAIAAKAVEDTFFYRFVALAAANEVGAGAGRVITSVTAFHAGIKERADAWPHAMLASATHDTKRGEDTRVRLDVLSEMPDEWARRVARWHVYNSVHRRDGGPSLNDEYLLYQTIVGAWPMRSGLMLRTPGAWEAFVERIKAYAIKAAREAKLETSWTSPNAAYETAYLSFIDRIFARRQDSPFIASVLRFLPTLMRLGAYNGLSQLTLKATLPGVPDFYQGSEFWDLSLVDPDNRRPVDYDSRIEAAGVADFEGARQHWRDGWLKLWVMRRLLNLRHRWPAMFGGASYEPLAVAGPASESIIAFARRSSDRMLVVLVGRLLAAQVRGDLAAFWPEPDFLAETAVHGVPHGAWFDHITGARITGCADGINAAAALAALPVAVLVRD